MKRKDLDPDPELNPTRIHRIRIRIHNTYIFLIQESGEDKEFMAVRKSLPAWDKRNEIIRSAVKTFLIPNPFQVLISTDFYLSENQELSKFFSVCSCPVNFFLFQTRWESFAIGCSWYENILWVRSSNPVTSSVYCYAVQFGVYVMTEYTENWEKYKEYFYPKTNHPK